MNEFRSLLGSINEDEEIARMIAALPKPGMVDRIRNINWDSVTAKASLVHSILTAITAIIGSTLAVASRSKELRKEVPQLYTSPALLAIQRSAEEAKKKLAAQDQYQQFASEIDAQVAMGKLDPERAQALKDREREGGGNSSYYGRRRPFNFESLSTYIDQKLNEETDNWGKAAVIMTGISIVIALVSQLAALTAKDKEFKNEIGNEVLTMRKGAMALQAKERADGTD